MSAIGEIFNSEIDGKGGADILNDREGVGSDSKKGAGKPLHSGKDNHSSGVPLVEKHSSKGDKNMVNVNIEMRQLRKRKIYTQKAFYFLFRSAAFINFLALATILYFMLSRGIQAISWEFLTKPPIDSMTKGGILPCIIGTFCLSIGAMVVAFPIGVSSAIFLNEYASQGKIMRMIRLCISNLAGVPSVVYGLFGLAFFVIYLKMGVSILAGALTLGVMTLPVIIGSTEEALKAVPDTYREASLGLGATKLQTILKVVLPAATPGILTGGILGISRAAGETAPVMFTAAVFFSPSLPTNVFSEIMALPYHIYVLATAGTEIEATRPLQYGTALVLITLVLGMNLLAIIYRARLRKKSKL